jgi:hypothetical protein
MLPSLRVLANRAVFCVVLVGQAAGQSFDGSGEPVAQIAVHSGQGRSEAHRIRAARFLGGRTEASGSSTIASINLARQQQAAMVVAQASGTVNTALNVNWQPIGPNQIASATYGAVTGRVTAIAIDPSDATGNTVYLGTTGGGVWRSTNAP